MDIRKKIVIITLSVLAILNRESYAGDGSRQFNVALPIGFEEDISIEFWNNPGKYIEAIKSRKSTIRRGDRCLLLASIKDGVGFKALLCDNWHMSSVFIRILGQTEKTRFADYQNCSVVKFNISGDKKCVESISGIMMQLRDGRAVLHSDRDNRCYLLPDRFTDPFSPSGKIVTGCDLAKCGPPIAVNQWIGHITSLMQKNGIDFDNAANVVDDVRLEKFMRDFEKSDFNFIVNPARP